MSEPTDAAVNAAAEKMVVELFGRTCRVGSMHREVAKAVLIAAEPHREAKPAETQPGRDGESTLSSSTERAAAYPAQPASWRAPMPPRPPLRAFGFGRPHIAPVETGEPRRSPAEADWDGSRDG